MYKLGYINGYNKLNTPKFINIQYQNEYFDNNVEYTIDAYYPPYYTNIIKLSIDDVPFNSRINFLYLIHNGKRYYYFINDINYINETIFEISIEMDVVQTFAFNVNINTANLVRETIKRWDSNNNINRDYVPENISEGIAEVVDFTEISLNGGSEELDYYVVWASKDFAEPGFSNSFCTIRNSDGTTNNTGLYCYLIPCFKNASYININYTYEIYIGQGSSPVATYTYLDLIGAASVLQSLDAAYTISMYRTNNSILSYEIPFSYTIDSANNKVQMRFQGTVIDAHFRYTNASNNYFALSLYLYHNDMHYNTSYDIKINNNSFQKNTSTDVLFDLKYCPQMIDENYINFLFGEKIFGSAPPLRKSKFIGISLHFGYDITTGVRCYCAILNGSSYDDKYNSCIQITIPLSMRIVNTAWSNYMAYHQGSMTTGVALQYTNLGFNTAKNVLGAFNSNVNYSNSYGNNSSSYKSTYDNKYIDMTSDDEPSWMKGISSGKNSNKSMSSNYNIGAGYSPTKIASSSINAVQEGYNITKNLQILKENLFNSPATVGQGSNFFADDASKSNKTYVSLSVVKDIVQCARKFEHYGYAVNKFKVYNCNIMELPKNRHYWDVYQMKNIDLTISSNNPCLISNDLLGKFVERLEAGIRIIYLDDLYQNDLLSNIIYDNVEEELL